MPNELKPGNGPNDSASVASSAAIPPPIPAAPIRVEPIAASPVPLDATQLAQIAAARERFKKIGRAIRYSRFDAWGVAIFAGLTIVCSLGSWFSPAMLLGIGMAVIAWVEFRYGNELKRLDSSAARRLGWNQFAFAVLLVAYAAWNLYAMGKGAKPLSDQIGNVSPDVSSELAPYDDLARLIMSCVYISLILVALVVQGGTGLFYFSREKYVRAFRDETPKWILQMQEAGLLG